MKILFFVLFITPVWVFAAGPAAPLLPFESDLKDKAGLQRGASHFMNYCAGCHSLKYMRYERIADDLEIPHELMEKHLIFSDQKIGSLVKNAASAKLQKQWFGAAPPDLTMASRSRGGQWLYSYLKGFYLDDTRPYGYNNLVFKDVGMPNVLAHLQGDQNCRPAFHENGGGYTKRDPISNQGIENPDAPCGRTAVIDGTGRLSEAEFDVFINDLVNFLIYTGEPMKLHEKSFFGFDLNQRQVIGVYCILFLAFFGIFAVLLNREYWKDIH